MSQRLLLLALLLPFALAPLAGCPTTADDDDDDSAMDDDDDDSVQLDFRMWMPAFEDGADLPDQYACFGPNPEILWEGVPEGAETLALIFDDPTAGNFPHWAIFNIPADETGLAEGISQSPNGGAGNLPGDAEELVNGFGERSYLGSCPGGRTNTYRWRLWALPGTLDTGAGASYTQLEADINDASPLEMVDYSHTSDASP